MHLEKIQTREQAVEFACRIAEGFFSQAEDSRWGEEGNRLPKRILRECRRATAQIRRWQTKPTLKVELVVIGSMLELEEMAESLDAPVRVMVDVAIAACSCVYEDNWRGWVRDASDAAMYYLALRYGSGSAGGMENGYQVWELAEILQLPLSQVADEFDDVEGIQEALDEEDEL